MTDPILVAFYQDTDLSNGEYAEHAKRLRVECKSVGQKASIVKRNYGDDYLAITRAKPLFMLEQLDKQDGPVLYVDVDSTVLKAWDYPESGRIGWAAKPNGRPYGHVHYLPNTDNTRDFLHTWLTILEDWEGGDHSAQWLAVKRTGLAWDALDNIGTRVRFGISTNEATKQAHAHLESIGWFDTVNTRLNG